MNRYPSGVSVLDIEAYQNFYSALDVCLRNDVGCPNDLIPMCMSYMPFFEIRWQFLNSQIHDHDDLAIEKEIEYDDAEEEDDDVFFRQCVSIQYNPQTRRLTLTLSTPALLLDSRFSLFRLIRTHQGVELKQHMHPIRFDSSTVVWEPVPTPLDRYRKMVQSGGKQMIFDIREPGTFVQGDLTLYVTRLSVTKDYIKLTAIEFPCPVDGFF